MSKAPAIGIDLGSSYSRVGVWQDGKVDIIPNDIGERRTPSYVSFTDDEIFIGDIAKSRIINNSSNTIFDIKKLIGRKYSNKQIQKNIKRWPFKVIKDPNSDKLQICANYQKQEKKYFPEEIVAIILQKLKLFATNFIGKEIKKAIITVPAYFKKPQRKAIKKAGTISGLKVIKIISEPTAAAIAYGLNKKSQIKEIENILIFNLGSDTLEISLLTLKKGLFKVKATKTIKHLGGDYINNKLIEYCTNEFFKKTSLDIKNNPKALRRLRASCEKAKKALSIATRTSIDIDSLMNGEDFNIIITRAKFEDLCKDLFEKNIFFIEKIINEEKLNKSQIDEVILIGGSTHIPKIQEMIQDFFYGKEINKNINPEEAVVLGASIKAAIVTKVKDKNIEKIILSNITPLSLGIETIGGIMTVLIPRSSPIPYKKSKVLSTSLNKQPSVIIKIFEGERIFTKDNRLLGELKLNGLLPMLRGQPIIEVTFYIDENFKLNIIVEDKITGKSNKIIITIDKKRTLNSDDINKIFKESEKFKDEDNKIKELIEIKSTVKQYCDNIIYEINKLKLKDTFSKDEKKQIEIKVYDIFKYIIENNSVSKEELDNKHKEIKDIFNTIIQKINQKDEGKKFKAKILLGNEENNLNNEIGLIQGNNFFSCSNIFTLYVEQKFEKDNEFKNNLIEIINIAKQNYNDIDNFIIGNKHFINIRQISFGLELLKKGSKILDNIFSICEIDLSDLIKQYKNEIDPFFKIKIKHKKKKNKLINGLEIIKNNRNAILNKINQKQEFKNIKSEELNNINIKEDEYIKNLNKELKAMEKEMKKIEKEMMELKKQIKILTIKNPLNYLGEYDKLIVCYSNKIDILKLFLNKCSLKMYSYRKKHPKFKC